MGVIVIVLHVSGEKWLPIAHREKEFLIVVARIVAAIDVNKAELPGVRAFVQIIHRHGV